MNLIDPRPVVFTAQSKRFFYCRDVICEFVLKQGGVPLNPFRVFEYFLGDRVDRDLVRQGNFNLIRISDELWVFGQTLADGVLEEIKYAHGLGKPIRFFTIGTLLRDFEEITFDRTRFESEISSDDPDRKAIEAMFIPPVDDNQLRLFE